MTGSAEDATPVVVVAAALAPMPMKTASERKTEVPVMAFISMATLIGLDGQV